MKNINPRRIPEDISKVYYENHYGYIYAKAELYLKIGKDRYRKGDAMGFPKTEWEQEFGSEIYDILEKGCKQILEYKGLTPEIPLEGLGISGFNMLLSLFHFKLLRQSLISNTEECFLDMMEMEHMVTGQKMTLYNRI
ncbi:MAG: hypothetical protein KBA61_13625 [Spirochaetes bacterium]|nr:hypothetical protein [Spirochaetota bacterium]